MKLFADSRQRNIANNIQIIFFQDIAYLAGCLFQPGTDRNHIREKPLDCI